MAEDRDDDRFSEIGDDGFDDSGNVYFPFRSWKDEAGEARSGKAEEDLREMALAVSEMLNDTVFSLISMLPPSLQSDAAEAYAAIIASNEDDGDAEAANRIFRRMWKHHRGPGAKLFEARNLRRMALEALDEGEDKAAELLKKERKALSEYIKASDDYPAFSYDDYLWARLESARIGIMLNESRGVFNAYLELPEGTGFSMADLAEAITARFEECEGEEWDEDSFMFETLSGNVIGVSYSDLDSMASTLPHDRFSEIASIVDETGSSGMTISILVSAEKDCSLAAFEFSSIVAACLECYPDIKAGVINNADVGTESLCLISKLADSGCFCAPVLFGFVKDCTDSGEQILRSCSAARWGVPDIAVKDCGKAGAAEMVLSDALMRHSRKALRKGSSVDTESGRFAVGEDSCKGEPILLLKEEGNGK